MFRFPVLRQYLWWWGLMEVGLAMRDGSYWREPLGDDRNYPEPAGPSGSNDW